MSGAEELVRARWTPSVRYPGRWDGPCLKLKGVPQKRALEIARRDARRDAGALRPETETTT